MLTRVAQFFATRVGAGLILAAGALSMTADVRADEPIKHSLFIAGPQFTGIIDEEEKVVWDAGRPGARDGFVLENGNLLIAWTNEVLEQTREKKVVFRYAISPENQEIGTVARLANGRTMITELGKNPRLLEVDADGKIVVEVKLAPETDNAHMQTRMAQAGKRQLSRAPPAGLQGEGIRARRQGRSRDRNRPATIRRSQGRELAFHGHCDERWKDLRQSDARRQIGHL